MYTSILLASQSNTPHCPSPWNEVKYEILPQTAQKKLVTKKIASIQLKSFYNIVNKTKELMKLEEWKKEKVKNESLEQREKMRKRHRKEGFREVVGKIRVLEDEKFGESSFGFYRRHRTGKLFDRLSKPKEKSLYSYGKSDLKGVLIGENSVCKDRLGDRMGARRSSM